MLQIHVTAAEYLIDSWDSEKGLPDNFVTSMVQTHDGYLWVGTYNGLARFDGARFEVFKPENTPQLAHGRIVKLFLDGQGKMWINTYDGSLTSWQDGVFRREWSGAKQGISEAWLVADKAREIIFAFRPGLLIRSRVKGGAPAEWQTLKPPGNPPGAYYCQDQAGALWCSTMDGNLWRITDGTFELMTNTGLRGREIHWLAPDLTGRIWVGTEKEIAAWDGKQFQNLTPEGEPELDVASIFFTRDGGAWVAANGRLRKFLNQKWGVEAGAWPDLMQEQEMQASLYEDREGGLWRVSRGLGLFHVKPDGATEQITTTNGLSGNHTTCWLQDEEGNLWVGLGNGGLARVRKKHFEVIGRSAGQPASPVMTVCEDRTGALWIGTYGSGLKRWQHGVLTRYATPAADPVKFVFSVYPAAAGQLWISAGMEDFSIFENGKIGPAPVAVHAVKSMLVDRQGRLWLGRKDGVDCWADGSLREWNSHNGSIGKPVRALAEDARGNIWAGSDDGNLYQFEGDHFRPFPPPEYPSHPAIWSLLADADGSLWAGTSSGGLLHFAGGHFTRFTSKDGLPDDMVCQILDDQQGDLWLGTHQGICRVSKASLRAFADGNAPVIACAVYDRSDGLPTLQCSGMYQPAAWKGRGGKLWFATVKGVVGVQPDTLPFNSRPPPVVIEKLLVDGKIWQQTGEKGSANAVLKIPPGQLNFEFHYTALSLNNADKIHFRYRLEGFDSAWVDATTRRWVQYNYLKPGRYCFRVAACNNDGVWNESGTTLSFQVLQHFWETWWFLGMLALVLLGGVASGAHHLSQRALRQEMERVERQRDIERDRTRIARDIHDHIGSGLTRINLLSELLLGDPSGQLPDRASQISGVTTELMQAMDEIVWAVNPKNDTLESLASYLCDCADEYLRMANIRLRMDVPAGLPALPLSSEVRHNLFLAVKEILNNIIKHSGAREVLLQLKLEAHSFTLEISDDGCGLAGKNEDGKLPGPLRNGGNGLNNLQNRAAMVGGSCRISSEPGKGTRIEIRVPLAATNGKKQYDAHHGFHR